MILLGNTIIFIQNTYWNTSCMNLILKLLNNQLWYSTKVQKILRVLLMVDSKETVIQHHDKPH